MFCLTAVLLLIVPATYRWWDGRRVRARQDDPAVAETWTAHVGRSTKVTLVCVLMFPMLCPEWAMPGMPGVILLSTAAGYPARRALFGERWSLLGYLEWSVRLFVAVLGYWALLAWTPYLVDLAGRYWLPVAATLAVTLGAWQYWYPQILLRILCAMPLDPTSFSRGFGDGVERVVRASPAERPTLWLAGPAGGIVANALALPSRAGSAVLFSRTLLETLSPAEATAIFAHEIAHLEHYDRRRLLRMMAVTWVLIVGAAASVPLTAMVAPEQSWIAITMWPVAVVIAMALRGRHSQKHETASDRRAAALCGDPEALASALIKLHTLARVPRRWSPEMDQRASHPSLARRLRDIRAGTQRPLSAQTAPVIVRGAAAGVWITIECDRVRILSGVPDGVSENVPDLVASAASALALPYDDVTELRVVSKRHRCLLQLASRDGRRFRYALTDADVQRVQAALDEVDEKIPAHAPASSDLGRIAIILPVLVGIAAAMVGQTWSLVAVAITSAIQMTPASLAGLAAGTGAAALKLLISDASVSTRLVALAVLAGCLILLWRAWLWRKRAPAANEPRWRPLVFTIGTIAAWAAAALPAANLLMLHRLASELPSVVILPAALAATLSWTIPRRRWSGVVATLLAAASLLVTSRWIAYRVIADPFLKSGSTFTSRPIQLVPIAAVTAPDNASSLALSRDASQFIVAIDEYDDEEEDRDDVRFVAGDFSGHSREIVAAAAAFVDDARLMVLTRAEGQLRLRLEALNESEERPWQTLVDMPGAAHIDTDPASGRWRITSRTKDRLFSIDGKGTAITGRREWVLPRALRARQWVSAETGQAFGWGVDAQNRPVGFWPFLQFANIDGVPFWTARFDTLGSDGPRALGHTLQEADCQTGPPGTAPLCFLTDGAMTGVWRFGDKDLELVGNIAGRASPDSGGASSKSILWIGSRAALVDIDRRELGWLRPADGTFAYDWTVVSATIGAIVDDGETTRIATFRYR